MLMGAITGDHYMRARQDCEQREAALPSGGLRLIWVALGCVQMTSRLSSSQLLQDTVGPAGKFVVLQRQQLETTEFNKAFCIDFIV